jgi:hypothetical protein
MGYTTWRGTGVIGATCGVRDYPDAREGPIHTPPYHLVVPLEGRA